MDKGDKTALVGAIAALALEVALQLSGYQSTPLSIVVAAIAVGCVIYIVWQWVLRKARAQISAGQDPAQRTAWEQQWHDLRRERRTFWRLLNAGFGNWSWKSETDNRSLTDLVSAAEFPAELPLQDNRQFPNWIWTASETFGADAKRLLQFATEIYIPSPAKAPIVMKSQILGTTHLFDDFDDVRMELSKFWDHWGRQEPLEQVIREQKVDALVKNHAAEIKLLTFLEIARKMWAGDDVPGKSGLFKLGRRNAETG